MQDTWTTLLLIIHNLLALKQERFRSESHGLLSVFVLLCSCVFITAGQLWSCGVGERS